MIKKLRGISIECLQNAISLLCCKVRYAKIYYSDITELVVVYLNFTLRNAVSCGFGYVAATHRTACGTAISVVDCYVSY